MLCFPPSLATHVPRRASLVAPHWGPWKRYSPLKGGGIKTPDEQTTHSKTGKRWNSYRWYILLSSSTTCTAQRLLPPLSTPFFLLSHNSNYFFPAHSLLQSFQMSSQVNTASAFPVKTECLLSFTVCLDCFPILKIWALGRCLLSLFPFRIPVSIWMQFDAGWWRDTEG